MKNKPKIILILTFMTVITLASTLILTKSYYPRLPIESISKREAVKLLNDNIQELTRLADGEIYSWYGYKGNQAEGGEALKQALTTKGWIFKEQLGSGYIFQDGSNTTRIVESQMWTGKYVLYKVPSG
jgi:hypothetical protein